VTISQNNNILTLKDVRKKLKVHYLKVKSAL